MAKSGRKTTLLSKASSLTPFVTSEDASEASIRVPFFGYRAPFFRYRVPFFGYHAPFFGYLDPFFGHRVPFFGYQVPFFGYRVPFIGYLDPFFGHRVPFNFFVLFWLLRVFHDSSILNLKSLQAKVTNFTKKCILLHKIAF